ncbi:unnamed protein product, partial [Chrysoparadoxa australica]
QASPSDTLAAICDQVGCDVRDGVATDAAQDKLVESPDEVSIGDLSLKHGDWLYMLKSAKASAAGASAAKASVDRMKKARARALKGGGVTEVATLAALEKELKAAKNMLVVIDFYADWCGPCKQIAPTYKKMASEYPKAVFLKVNVDSNKPTAQKYKVQSMPTFVMIKKGSVVDELKGADEGTLRSKIR